MFIATSVHPKLAPFRSETGSGTIGEPGKEDCAPAELGVKKDRQAINISPRWGEDGQGGVALQT